MENTEQAVERPENADELDALDQEAEAAEPANDPEHGDAPDESPAGDVISNHQAVAMALGPAFGVLAPRWDIQPNEIEQLATAYGDLLDKYMPGGMHIGVELNAFLITAMVLGPHLGEPRTDAIAAKRAEKARRKREAMEAAKAAEAPDAPPAANDDDVSDGGQHGPAS